MEKAKIRSQTGKERSDGLLIRRDEEGWLCYWKVDVDGNCSSQGEIIRPELITHSCSITIGSSHTKSPGSF